MSESANVALARRLMATGTAVRDGDTSVLEAIVHPDFEWHSDPRLPGGGTHRGLAAVARFLQDFLASWDDYDVDPEEIIESGARVLVIARVHARGRGSGVELDQRIGYLHTVRNSRVARTDAYFDVEEARRALEDKP
jgi:ketosteroid isomerase-like protein